MFTQIIPLEMFAGVADFMRIMDTNRDFAWWAETLIAEETKELKKADAEDEGMEQIFKESADLFYVVSGFYNCIPANAQPLLTEERHAAIAEILQDAWNTLATVSTKYKIPMNLFGEAFAIVHMSNMSKLDENGEPIRREDGKILKGPNYQPPNMAPVVMKWDKLMEQLKQQESTSDAETPE